MVAEWPMVPLEDVAELSGGFAFKSEDYAADGRFILRTLNIQDDGSINRDDAVFLPLEKCDLYKRFELQEHDTLFVMVGATLGKVGYVRRETLPALLNQNMWRIRGRSGHCDKRYLQYAFRNSVAKNLGWASGSARDFVRRDDYRRMEIPLPPLGEQKAIAAVLGALDDKIELNRRINATLEAMARVIFQSWFVNFDPVRVKLDGRKSEGLDDATAELFPEHFEDSEHGKLPAGWRYAAIEEVCTLNAWTLGKHDRLETLEYVEISEVSRGNIANTVTYTRGKEPSRARRRLRHGDTVLSTVRPDRGSYFLALNPPQNRIASTGFAVLTPTKVPWSFVYSATTQPEVSDYLGQMADGGAYPAVRPEVVGAIKIPLPDAPKILEAFHRRCAPLFERAEANRAESRTLAKVRDALLPKLLSGQLQVSPTSR